MTVLVPQFSRSGTNSMLNFFTGALDIAYMGISPLTLAYNYHLPVKVVAIANSHLGSLAVLESNSGGQSPGDGRRKLGTTQGSDGEVLAHHFENDRPDLDLTIVNLSPRECVDALDIGMLDYAALWEPYVSMLENQGARRVYSDQDLDFSIHSFLVCTESALREQAGDISRFVRLHNEALDRMEENLAPYLEQLRLIFGEALPISRYREVLTRDYDWPKSDFLSRADVPDHLERSLRRVFDTHHELRGESSPEFRVEEFFPGIERSDSEGGGERLTLGYSQSIMCTTFHVADIAGLFAEHGIDVEGSLRRVEERIALLPEPFSNDLKLCHELLPRDPQLVIQKLGRMNEQIFRKIEREVLGQETKSLAAVIDNVRATDLVSRDILSWADSIRSIRNVATHEDETISREEAKNAFRIFLKIAEWYEGDGEQILGRTLCPRCGKDVHEDWRACANCGYALERKCPECGRQVEVNWTACPYCGENLD